MTNEKKLAHAVIDLEGWDKPLPTHEPLPGQLELVFTESKPHTVITNTGQGMLFDSGQDLPGIDDLVERGQNLLFGVSD